ncbi:MAG: hypothetical protein GKR90_22685 [Pseudomonadales bacterium]|nr:hypothetical protein [Pseudomonadales bacterium]
MSISDMGSLGELIAAVATVATLIYLAIQVRHAKESTDANTRQMRGEAFVHLSERVSEQLGWLRTHRGEAADIIKAIGIENWDDLTLEERQLAMFWNLEEATYHELAFMLWHEGAIDEQSYVSREEYWLYCLLAPGRRFWWDNYVYLLDERFIARINERLAEQDNLGPEDLRKRFPMLLVDENEKA